MPWRYRGADNKVAIVLDPNYAGDLSAIAAWRPVWIIETDATRPAIDYSLITGAAANLCEVNRCPLPNPDDREGNLLLILGMLDDHYYPYAGFFSYGLKATPLLKSILENEGFSITDAEGDTFSATLNTDVRDQVIGRNVKK
jgi:hypothetical protein